MKRLLISGVNPLAFGHIPKMGYIHSVKAVLGGLRQNHQVDIRPVKLGENFAEYDRVIIYLNMMRGFLSKGTLTTLWALHKASDKIVLSFDDWQIKEAMAGIINFAAQRDLIMEKNPFGYLEYENYKPYWKELSQSLDRLIQPRWDWPVVLPCYDGGDLSLFKLPDCKISTYNPSIFFKDYYSAGGVTGTVKNTHWILAALHNHGSWLKKQKLKWTVKEFGHRKQGQPRVTESEIFNEYKSSVGVLSPAYKHSGSSWWRARGGLAADAHSVLAGDPKELAMIDSDVYSFTPQEVESMTSEELQQVALAQKLAFYKAAGTLEQFTAKLEECFKVH